ncbi:MAG: hypothetical protein QM504_14035 [Pseudomonadota bacterium]
MKKLSSLFIVSFIFSLLIISASSAGNRAGIHPLLSDDFSGSLGWFYASTETNLSANGRINGDIGDIIDFENDLGFDDSSSIFLGDFKWRFAESFHLSFEYLSINRDASAVLNKDISWDDNDFAAGASVDSSFNVNVSRLFVGYSFMQSKQMELGAGIGLHFMDMEAQLSGNATVNGVPVGHVIKGEDFLAPLPNIGFYGAYAFSPRFIATGRADWFSAKIGDYDGTLTSLAADIQYQAFKHVGFGAGYHYLNVDITATKGSWNGQADYSYHGPKIFMTINF